MSLSDTFEAYALRYASIKTSKLAKYHQYATYDEPDEPLFLDFFFWLLRNRDRTVLVDCGFNADRARTRGLVQDHRPVELLSRFGVKPEDVDHVVISHMHFDHSGNVELFPNATFSVARDELEFWTGPYATRPHLGFNTDSAEVQMILNLHRDGRVHLVTGPEELFPGIKVTPIRGHTPGQMVTEVSTRSGTVVLASDAIHFYEEMERDRPYWTFFDLEGVYKGHAYLNDLAARPDVAIVAGHDRAVMTRFKTVDDDCVDLTTRCG
ncbi:N-acyl homoserine lactonase family protein [Rhodococcus koreensis]|uniref:N-acyl homoserine lactonase family protein n=1 Tax=Rhodococcus koreensis TaxID=99653 RepID=UPI00366D9531